MGTETLRPLLPRVRYSTVLVGMVLDTVETGFDLQELFNSTRCQKNSCGTSIFTLPTL